MDRQLYLFDEVEHDSAPGEYGIITEVIELPNAYREMVTHFRVAWYDETSGFYTRSQLNYICPLSEVI